MTPEMSATWEGSRQAEQDIAWMTCQEGVSEWLRTWYCRVDKEAGANPEITSTGLKKHRVLPLPS